MKKFISLSVLLMCMLMFAAHGECKTPEDFNNVNKNYAYSKHQPQINNFEKAKPPASVQNKKLNEKQKFKNKNYFTNNHHKNHISTKPHKSKYYVQKHNKYKYSNHHKKMNNIGHYNKGKYYYKAGKKGFYKA